MLNSLHIENIAVIKSVDIDFASGFTALTGETGAGKSIVLDSVSFLMGAKADRGLIRHGESSALVCGLFTELPFKILQKCAELGINVDEDKSLYVQRSISVDGKSQIKVNGNMINLSLLRKIAPDLIDIHGQGDTGILLDPSSHVDILDIYASSLSLLEKYDERYNRYERLRKELQDVQKKALDSERLRAILEYQIRDIDEVDPHIGEEENLIDRKVKIKNSEKILKNSEFAYKALKGSEKGSAVFLIDRTCTALSQLEGIIPEYSEYNEKLKEALCQVEDIAEGIYSIIENAVDDPTSALNEIESRLDKIAKIKRKYGLTVESVIEFRDNAKKELDMLENMGTVMQKLKAEEEVAYRDALAVADELSALRRKSAGDIKTAVCSILQFLDMPNVVFYPDFSVEYFQGNKVLNKHGYDNIEFYISTNKGANAQPISKIASGGELARVMLAIKSVIADKDGVLTVVFDEVDTGVSGKTARKIGIKMKELSSKIQVLSVTHSAQIASLADKHLLIKKADINGKTETSVVDLDYNGRVSELSRILGGINVTSSQRAAAIDMLNESEN